MQYRNNCNNMTRRPAREIREIVRDGSLICRAIARGRIQIAPRSVRLPETALTVGPVQAAETAQSAASLPGPSLPDVVVTAQSSPMSGEQAFARPGDLLRCDGDGENAGGDPILVSPDAN